MAKGMVEFRGYAITIICTDQRRSERFYEGVLGASRLPGDGYGCSWFSLGALTLTLMPNAGRSAPAICPADAMAVPWLEVDDLAAARQHLLSKGVPIPDYHENLFLVCLDPDGVAIEVWQAQPDE